MSGPSFWEFLLLCMIGLIVLGPKRLPQVANQVGTWIGHARRMTRTLKRQLEEELELEKPLNVRPSIQHAPPRSDDSYSPLHKPTSLSVGAATAESGQPVTAESGPPATVDGDAASPGGSEAAGVPGTDSEQRREA